MDNEKSKKFLFTEKNTIEALGPALLLNEGRNQDNRRMRKCYQLGILIKQSGNIPVNEIVARGIALF